MQAMQCERVVHLHNEHACHVDEQKKMEQQQQNNNELTRIPFLGWHDKHLKNEDKTARHQSNAQYVEGGLDIVKGECLCPVHIKPIGDQMVHNKRVLRLLVPQIQ